MKIRIGFVTNSSSSSYVCDICGNEQSGYDMSLEDAYMVQCSNGHTFCEDHILEGFKRVDNEESDDYDEDWRWQLKSDYCPICQFKHLVAEDYLSFMLKDTGITKELILAVFSSRFKDYKTFKNFLKG